MQQNNDSFGSQNPYQSPLFTSTVPENSAREIFEGENFHPFRMIWTRPRATIRSIIAINPQLHVTWLICLLGIINSLDRASARNLGDKASLWTILGMACVLGPLSGLISFWIFSHLIRFTGEWIGGVGNREHIKTAMAWASVPVIITLPLWVIEILIFGSDLFTTETPRLDAQPIWLIPLVAFSLIELVLGIWSFVLLCNTIAEVQKFQSAWRGFGNLILAGLAFVIPLIALVFVVIFLTSGIRA